MGKKLGDFTIRELFEECEANPSSCVCCKFFGLTFCDISSPAEYFDECDLNREVNTDEELDIEPEKNDSSANLEGRIKKLEADVAELWARYLK